MKRILLLGAIGFSITISAQTIAELKKEINDIKTSIAHLHTEIQSVKSENLYYKKSLEINKPIAQGRVNGLEFTVTNITGNRKDKTLVITYLYKNISKEVRRDYHGTQAYIVDERGNQTNTYDVLASNKGVRVEQVHPDIPMKGFIKFKLDEIDFPVIKLLHLQFAYVGKEIGQGSQNVVFKYLPVMWE